MIVSDSGPIIAFSRVGRLDILKRLFGHVIIPDAVYEELVVMGKGRPGEPEVRQSAWIQRRSVRNRERMDRFSQKPTRRRAGCHIPCSRACGAVAHRRTAR